MTVADLKTNMKVRIRAEGDAGAGFVMIVSSITPEQVKFKMRHTGPIGGKASDVWFYVRDGKLTDVRGVVLTIEKFTKRGLSATGTEPRPDAVQ
jgi:hypothetical protein